MSLGHLFEVVEAGSPTRLQASRCSRCGRVEFPVQGPLCPACRGATTTIGLAGPARLVGKTSVLAQPPGAKVQAPYDVGVAEFPEGIRIIGLIAGTAELGAAVVPIAHQGAPDLLTYGFRAEPE